MNRFTVEEINLISIFESKSRTKVIHDVSETMKYQDDEEIRELSSRVLKKLNNMSDEEFADMEFIAAE